MASPDDQHRLNSRQRREIDQIGQKFHFNLAPPPSSLDEITTSPKFVSLTEFIGQFDWQYSDLDIVDRLEIADLALEDFWHYIATSEVAIQGPGHLSPVTVAKCIEYGVNLLGCFIEGYVSSKQMVGKQADFGTMTRGDGAACRRRLVYQCSYLRRLSSSQRLSSSRRRSSSWRLKSSSRRR